jgi:hypothetical protein
MSAVRTQIYLTEEQRLRIDRVVDEQGLTMAEVVRRALDAYLDSAAPDPSLALAATFGTNPDFEVPDRNEWDRA